MSSEKRTPEEVRAYWTDAATKSVDQDGLRPTARDPFLQQAVEDAMERLIGPGARLLDVGCGDGESTCRFAVRAANVVGVDYIDEYVERSVKLAKDRGITNASFMTGDVQDLSPVIEKHGLFDIATSIRCLINLTDWDMQKRGLHQIASCVKPGGLYVTSEGWTDGVDGLNRMRERRGLPPFNVVGYNRTMTRLAFEEEAREDFIIEDYVSLGFYIFMSRVFQPAFTAPEQPRHDHDINRIAADLQNMPEMRGVFDSCDYAGVYVLRRKG
ncbi:class I SAM-dependent methyltransferase [Minwuia sp.]|uniref:class I SAM-dependent methyltransferase n=1 Tax=Minwuia sp. TaxID=2493630 RepID=UPI003A9363A5